MRAVLISCLVLALAAADACAQGESPLGNGTLALKFDYLRFTGRHLGSLDEDDGIYIALEGFRRIRPNLYLGGEIGQGTNVSLVFGEDIQFYVFELNLKYAGDLSPRLVLDAGAGPSYNYVSIYELDFFDGNRERDDWLLGGQAFADLTYRFGRFCAGLHAKFQRTQDFEGGRGDYSNTRVGVQFGYSP